MDTAESTARDTEEVEIVVHRHDRDLAKVAVARPGRVGVDRPGLAIIIRVGQTGLIQVPVAWLAPFADGHVVQHDAVTNRDSVGRDDRNLWAFDHVLGDQHFGVSGRSSIMRSKVRPSLGSSSVMIAATLLRQSLLWRSERVAEHHVDRAVVLERVAQIGAVHAVSSSGVVDRIGSGQNRDDPGRADAGGLGCGLLRQ